jgi:hypothetical protein
MRNLLVVRVALSKANARRESRRFSPLGRFEFITRLRHEPRVLPDFPLTLVTNYSKKWLLSRIPEQEHPSIASVRIGPETAAASGIESGGRAIILRRDPRADRADRRRLTREPGAAPAG